MPQQLAAATVDPDLPLGPESGELLVLRGVFGDHPGQRPVLRRGCRRSHNLALGTLTERSLGVAGVVREVAGELGHTPAQVALAWTLRKPGVTSTLLGARTPAQLEDNPGALTVELTDAQLARLDAAGAIAPGQPHELPASEPIRRVTTGDLRIETCR
nr:hypothetical protein KitaXyl93_00220 [Kitasatospora sp. Xyl93]